MADLKTLFTLLGFHNVQTYIQSGNLIFDSEIIPNAQQLETEIQNTFLTQNVAVLIKNPVEIQHIIEQNPFASKTDFDPKKMHVCYFQHPPSVKNIKTFEGLNFGEDEFKITPKNMYLYFAEGAGKTKLTTAIIENKLVIKTTSRNWNTTVKLFTLSSK
jgi:uncharacterized protein (DUF1697 family)